MHAPCAAPDLLSSLGAHFEREFRVGEPAHYVDDTHMPLVAEEEMRVVPHFPPETSSCLALAM